MRGNPLVSIIIPCKNEGKNIRWTLESFHSHTRNPGYEIIVIDDGSTDGCCDFLRERPSSVKILTTTGLGAAQARNLGAQHAAGKILVFCDAHVQVEDGWLEKMRFPVNSNIGAMVPSMAAIEQPFNVGYGQTWNENLAVRWLLDHPQGVVAVPLAPGGFMVVNKRAFDDVGGFNDAFRVWGQEDVEFSLRLWLFGYTIYVNPYVKVYHLFRQRHPYPVRQEHVHYNVLYMAFSHFKSERVIKTLELLKKDPNLFNTLADVIFGDVWQRRQEYQRRRKHDDDWFMDHFQIPF